MSATLAAQIQAASAISVLAGVILAMVGYRFGWDRSVRRTTITIIAVVMAFTVSREVKYHGRHTGRKISRHGLVTA